VDGRAEPDGRRHGHVGSCAGEQKSQAEHETLRTRRDGTWASPH
jgi:hypothetical protein